MSDAPTTLAHWERTGPSALCWESPRLRVYRDPTVNPGGQQVHYDRVETASLVRVAALKAGRVALIEQEHYLLARTMLQLPGGQIRPDEDPAAAAHRELSEETGLVGGVLRAHGQVYPMPGLTGAGVHLFSMVWPEQGVARPDVGEADIQVRWLPLAEAAEATECAASVAFLGRLLAAGTLDAGTPCIAAAPSTP